MWIFGAALGTLLICRDLLRPAAFHLPGRDFTNLWVAGRLALADESWCAFEVDCFRVRMVEMLDLATFQNFSYPPHALFVAAPFSAPPYFVALGLWTLAGIAFFAFAARPFLPRGFPPLLAAFTTAGVLNIASGHYGFLYGGLWLLFFRWYDRNSKVAGILAGLLTIKPHLGVMIAATALRRLPVFAYAVLATLALVAASALLFGPGRWLEFFSATAAMQGEILTGRSEELSIFMPTAYVAFGRGAPGIAGQLLFAAGAVALLWRSRASDPFTAATATFLIVPYAFGYDMTVACLGFAVLLHARWGALSWAERAGLMLAFWTPQLLLLAPLIPFALLYALSIQVRFQSYAGGYLNARRGL